MIIFRLKIILIQSFLNLIKISLKTLCFNSFDEFAAIISKTTLHQNLPFNFESESDFIKLYFGKVICFDCILFLSSGLVRMSDKLFFKNFLSREEIEGVVGGCKDFLFLVLNKLELCLSWRNGWNTVKNSGMKETLDCKLY